MKAYNTGSSLAHNHVRRMLKLEDSEQSETNEEFYNLNADLINGKLMLFMVEL